MIKINGHVHLRHAGSRRPQGELSRIQLTIIDFLPAKQAGQLAHKERSTLKIKSRAWVVNTVDYRRRSNTRDQQQSAISIRIASTAPLSWASERV
ncbi:hypothetical protein [Frankia sp. Cj3]|uniref:hypothetical protein n=1 Tax=Frankia sp. Cj3 TaxID=2880976 RepID=UPI001EF403FD|nr:hypothetical protein [Frankia sp. Cj3]